MGMATNAMSPVICSCGLAHSPAEWKKLPLVGIQRFDGGGALELRNCPCGSTRAIDVNANTCACVSVTRDGDTIDLVVYGVAHTPDEVSDVELLSVHLDAAGEPEWTGASLSDAEYDRACRALLEASEEQEQRRAMLEAMGEWAATRAVEEAPEADIFDRIDRAYEMVKEARCAS
jgi:hypothetical protein